MTFESQTGTVRAGTRRATGTHTLTQAEYERTAEEPTFDLRFKHLTDAGVVFLRTVPISQDRRSTKLRVLVSQFVEQVAGAGYEVVMLNRGSTVVVEKRYAAAVVEEGPATLGGLEAYFATMDIANLDQLKVDPNARKERVQLVILHTGFSYKPRTKKGKASFPVIMVAGYANQQEDFKRGLPEFHEFLGIAFLVVKLPCCPRKRRTLRG